MAVPPPEGPPPRRPFYYPLAPVGCLFWIFVLLLIWLLVGWFWAPVWWPWYR